MTPPKKQFQVRLTTKNAIIIRHLVRAQSSIEAYSLTLRKLPQQMTAGISGISVRFVGESS